MLNIHIEKPSINKSLVYYFLVHMSAPSPHAGHGIMILLSTEQHAQVLSKRTVVIKQKIPESEQAIMYSIPVVLAINDSAFPEWVETFREISKMLQWPDTASMSFLCLAVDSHLWNCFKTKTTLDTALDALLQHAFSSCKKLFMNNKYQTRELPNYT